MNKFLRGFSKLANNRDIKHVFHKLEPITDAVINKVAAKVEGYKTGGRVKGKKKDSPKIIKAHVGEYVLPVGVKPTKTQKMAVAKRKSKAMKC